MSQRFVAFVELLSLGFATIGPWKTLIAIVGQLVRPRQHATV